MRKMLLSIVILLITACAGLEPKMVSSMDLNLQSKLLYESSYENVQQAVLDSFKEKGWLLLYEGKKYPEGERAKYSNMSHNPFSSARIAGKSTEVYDRLAIEKSLRSNAAPTYYMQAKTPTSAFSYGAEIFVIFFDFGSNGTELAITAASGQGLEKSKLEVYIQEMSELVGANVN